MLVKVTKVCHKYNCPRVSSIGKLSRKEIINSNDGSNKSLLETRGSSDSKQTYILKARNANKADYKEVIQR